MKEMNNIYENDKKNPKYLYDLLCSRIDFQPYNYGICGR